LLFTGSFIFFCYLFWWIIEFNDIRSFILFALSHWLSLDWSFYLIFSMFFIMYGFILLFIIFFFLIFVFCLVFIWIFFCNCITLSILILIFLFKILFRRSSLTKIYMITPTFLMKPRETGLTLSYIIFFNSSILTMAENSMIALLITLDPNERTLTVLGFNFSNLWIYGLVKYEFFITLGIMWTCSFLFEAVSLVIICIFEEHLERPFDWHLIFKLISL